MYEVAPVLDDLCEIYQFSKGRKRPVLKNLYNKRSLSLTMKLSHGISFKKMFTNIVTCQNAMPMATISEHEEVFKCLLGECFTYGKFNVG